MAKLTLPATATTLMLKTRQPMAPSEWRCLECHKLLGVRHGCKLHVRMHGHDYQVSLPVEAICRNCNAFNQT